MTPKSNAQGHISKFTLRKRILFGTPYKRQAGLERV